MTINWDFVETTEEAIYALTSRAKTCQNLISHSHRNKKDTQRIQEDLKDIIELANKSLEFLNKEAEFPKPCNP